MKGAGFFRESTVFRAVRFYDPHRKPAGHCARRSGSNSYTCARHVAQAVHKSLVMLNKTENMNTRQDALPVAVAAVNFTAEVLESKQPVLVEFWAPWSRSCQVFDAVLAELADTLAGSVKVTKVNADDNLELSLWYDIQSVPTLLCFVEGNARLRIVGTATKEAILAKLKPLSE